jgi:uncharacterized protein involved in exopolysaccharide biosynthesis
VFGPLIAGVLAGGLSFFLPQRFESIAMLKLSEQEAALLLTDRVTGPLIQKFNRLAQFDATDSDIAAGYLKERLKFRIDKQSKLITVTVTGRTPDEAQKLAEEAFIALFEELRVKGKEKDLIEKYIALNNRQIEEAEDVIKSIQNGLKRRWVNSDRYQESEVRSLLIVNAEVAKLSKLNAEYHEKLKPKGDEVFVQTPSLPKRSASPKRGLIVLLAILASGFALLIFVFIRKAWASVAQEEETVKKIVLIKKAFQFK